GRDISRVLPHSPRSARTRSHPHSAVYGVSPCHMPPYPRGLPRPPSARSFSASSRSYPPGAALRGCRADVASRCYPRHTRLCRCPILIPRHVLFGVSVGGRPMSTSSLVDSPCALG